MGLGYNPDDGKKKLNEAAEQTPTWWKNTMEGDISHYVESFIEVSKFLKSQGR